MRVEQTGELSCAAQCTEALPKMAQRIALEETTGALARALRSCLPRDVGFTIVLFDYGTEGSMAYASSAKRRDVRSMLRELLDKLEATRG